MGNRRARAAQQRAAFLSIPNVQQLAMEPALEPIPFYPRSRSWAGCRRGKGGSVCGSDSTGLLFCFK